MREPRDPVELALLFIEFLQKKEMEYAVGGAIALGYWGIPRGTIDVDVTVFIKIDEMDQLVAILDAMSCIFDAVEARRHAEERGAFRVFCHGMRLDIFLPDIELYESARARRRQVPLEGRLIWIWSAEDLIIFKLLYYRLKDQADIEQIVEIQGNSLDSDYIRTWLVNMVGEEDTRISWWDTHNISA
ncbi:MAG: hypothetical protein RDV48_30695 [Candidatus Eremiobacteraeota bacterium]|nr:hypothetical protein [Candidatus Eremiobacteraeota bacterium]